MLDYHTHAQAAPQLATFLSTSGATMNYDGKSPTNEDDDDAVVNPSMARKASDKEDKFMSHLNTPAYKISDDQALLCPARVRGYAFVEKTWAFFMVERVQEIEWHSDAFASLELESRMKSAITAMVSVHQNQDGFDVSHIPLDVSNSMLTTGGYYTRERERPCVLTLWQARTWEDSDSRYVITSIESKDLANTNKRLLLST
jgi:hypothetical protein